MSKHNVFVNSRSVIHKGSGDKAMSSAPDVCKTPVGSAVVPIPYPNISKSTTLKRGSKSIKINGNPSALKSSNFASSSGDDAGSLGGIISGVTGKKTEFMSYSFDVKFEGENVVRHADMTTHNNKNTLGMVLGSSTSPVIIKIEDTESKCELCGKKRHEFAKKIGKNVGSGSLLSKSIIADIKSHPWYVGSSSLEAHHLICSEAMDEDDWSKYAREFGYNINHQNNGIILPHTMPLACQLHAPLHRGNHNKGTADYLPYPKKIKLDLKEIKDDIKAGKYCGNPQALVAKLDKYSKHVLKKLNNFSWTITADGKDYKANGRGCSGVESITKKPTHLCPCERQHKIVDSQQMVISKKSQALQIGM